MMSKVRCLYFKRSVVETSQDMQSHHREGSVARVNGLLSELSLQAHSFGFGLWSGLKVLNYVGSSECTMPLAASLSFSLQPVATHTVRLAVRKVGV